MKDKTAKYLKEIAIFFIIMTILANILSLYRSSDLNKSALNMPPVTLINNSSYTLPKGEPVLIYFWATWCPTCRAEAPNIELISKKFNVLTVALKSGNDSKIEEYLKSQDLSFRVINDYDGSITQKFNISVFPTTIIYDREGNELFSDVGYTTTLGLWLKMWWVSL
ncbi:MAG: protein disulfide oxidoreductase [Sulfurimonas sp.]|uniref:protein disulfide oxidoreductase n=1 Tax=Sulfurimonas sp. TaxID=2022749 RepID=UPI0026275D1E|nr:protein disulfide oxidoreductase [Sulfurimonas sp.]MDD5399800.1 protein disulfide oxidoreductase [Sulfurimonas sp.]